MRQDSERYIKMVERDKVAFELMIVQGKSASEVAPIVGSSRSAVCGMVHRHKIRFGIEVPKQPGKRRAKALPVAEREALMRASKPVKFDIGFKFEWRVIGAVTQGKTLMELPDTGACRFPLKNRNEFGQTLYCGHRTDFRKTYCKQHQKVLTGVPKDA